MKHSWTVERVEHWWGTSYRYRCSECGKHFTQAHAHADHGEVEPDDYLTEEGRVCGVRGRK